MIVRILDDKTKLGHAAAEHAACILRDALSARGRARIVAATGASQFEFLDALARTSRIDWTKVELFHLDEYLDLPATHPASFRRYLRERLIDPCDIARHHLLELDNNVPDVIANVSAAIREAPIDVAFVGIGENGHLAFNDPPADFDVDDPYIVVELDEACRRQQVGEGWFSSFEEVPTRAVSMSIRQILRSREIVCVVPDRRKAEAVKASVGGPVTPNVPASALQTHAATTLYLDPDSASLLDARGSR